MPVVVALPISVASELAMSANGGKRSRYSSSASRAKLDRSRQTARECRARKNLRYQYLEELTASREKVVYALREELNKVSGKILSYDMTCEYFWPAQTAKFTQFS